MDKLDFLSGAPKTLIFEKSSNKTNFGGSLTILYLIILLVIIIIYMVNYAINPKYSVLYTYEHQFNADTEYINKRYNDTGLNPKITFNFKMDTGINENHFEIYYFNTSTNETTKVEFGKVAVPVGVCGTPRYTQALARECLPVVVAGMGVAAVPEVVEEHSAHPVTGRKRAFIIGRCLHIQDRITAL